MNDKKTKKIICDEKLGGMLRAWACLVAFGAVEPTVAEMVSQAISGYCTAAGKILGVALDSAEAYAVAGTAMAAADLLHDEQLVDLIEADEKLIGIIETALSD